MIASHFSYKKPNRNCLVRAFLTDHSQVRKKSNRISIYSNKKNNRTRYLHQNKHILWNHIESESYTGNFKSGYTSDQQRKNYKKFSTLPELTWKLFCYQLLYFEAKFFLKTCSDDYNFLFFSFDALLTFIFQN